MRAPDSAKKGPALLERRRTAAQGRPVDTAVPGPPFLDVIHNEEVDVEDGDRDSSAAHFQ